MGTIAGATNPEALFQKTRAATMRDVLFNTMMCGPFGLKWTPQQLILHLASKSFRQYIIYKFITYTYRGENPYKKSPNDLAHFTFRNHH